MLSSALQRMDAVLNMNTLLFVNQMRIDSEIQKINAQKRRIAENTRARIHNSLVPEGETWFEVLSSFEEGKPPVRVKSEYHLLNMSHAQLRALFNYYYGTDVEMDHLTYRAYIRDAIGCRPHKCTTRLPRSPPSRQVSGTGPPRFDWETTFSPLVDAAHSWRPPTTNPLPQGTLEAFGPDPSTTLNSLMTQALESVGIAVPDAIGPRPDQHPHWTPSVASADDSCSMSANEMPQTPSPVRPTALDVVMEDETASAEVSFTSVASQQPLSPSPPPRVLSVSKPRTPPARVESPFFVPTRPRSPGTPGTMISLSPPASPSAPRRPSTFTQSQNRSVSVSSLSSVRSTASSDTALAHASTARPQLPQRERPKSVAMEQLDSLLLTELDWDSGDISVGSIASASVASIAPSPARALPVAPAAPSPVAHVPAKLAVSPVAERVTSAPAPVSAEPLAASAPVAAPMVTPILTSTALPTAPMSTPAPDPATPVTLPEPSPQPQPPRGASGPFGTGLSMGLAARIPSLLGAGTAKPRATPTHRSGMSVSERLAASFAASRAAKAAAGDPAAAPAPAAPLAVPTLSIPQVSIPVSDPVPVSKSPVSQVSPVPIASTTVSQHTSTNTSTTTTTTATHAPATVSPNPAPAALPPASEAEVELVPEAEAEPESEVELYAANPHPLGSSTSSTSSHGTMLSIDGELPAIPEDVERTPEASPEPKSVLRASTTSALTSSTTSIVSATSTISRTSASTTSTTSSMSKTVVAPAPRPFASSTSRAPASLASSTSSQPQAPSVSSQPSLASSVSSQISTTFLQLSTSATTSHSMDNSRTEEATSVPSPARTSKPLPPAPAPEADPITRPETPDLLPPGITDWESLLRNTPTPPRLTSSLTGSTTSHRERSTAEPFSLRPNSALSSSSSRPLSASTTRTSRPSYNTILSTSGSGSPRISRPAYNTVLSSSGNRPLPKTPPAAPKTPTKLSHSVPSSPLAAPPVSAGKREHTAPPSPLGNGRRAETYASPSARPLPPAPGPTPLTPTRTLAASTSALPNNTALHAPVARSPVKLAALEASPRMSPLASPSRSRFAPSPSHSPHHHNVHPAAAVAAQTTGGRKFTPTRYVSGTGTVFDAPAAPPPTSFAPNLSSPKGGNKRGASEPPLGAAPGKVGGLKRRAEYSSILEFWKNSGE